MKPPLCLLCGHLAPVGEGGCPACGKPPPEVTCQSLESYKPGQRAAIAVGLPIIGLFVGGLGVLLVVTAFRAPSLGAPQLILLGFAALLVFVAGLMFWAGGYTALSRGYDFNTGDERVYARVWTLAGRVWKAFGMHYPTAPLPLPAAAARLTSATATAPALRAALAGLAAPGPVKDFGQLDDVLLLVMAALFGMAARGEVRLFSGEARRFWIREQPKAPPVVHDRVWLQRTNGAVPEGAFERVVLRALDALSDERAARAAEGAATYRRGAEREEAPLVPLLDVMARVGLEGDVGDLDTWANVRALFEAGAEDGGVGEVLAQAVREAPGAALGLALEASDGIELAAG